MQLGQGFSPLSPHTADLPEGSCPSEESGAAGSTVPDGSGPASCRNQVRLSPSCAVAGHSAATGSVESPQKLSGFEVDHGSSRAVGLKEALIGEDLMRRGVRDDDSPVHDDGPEEYLLDHVHVVGGD